MNDKLNTTIIVLLLYTQNEDTKAPLLLWLQGGPGESSLFGLFNENGPIMVDKSGNG